MGDEVRITDYDPVTGNDDNRVSEWEDGLPNGDDLMPLSQLLISPELLTAFNITPEPYSSMIDVNRASQNTLANLRAESESGQPSLTRFDSSKAVAIDVEDKEDDIIDVAPDGAETEPATATTEMDLQTDDPTSRVLKRARLVWTPQLHKRFIEVVAHLGVKNAVPKTIMQLMNVEGLTRENVASHLQKYRLYLKRMQGGSSQDGGVGSGSGSGSDHVNLHESGGSRNGFGYRPMASAPQMVHHMPYQAHGNRSWNGNGFDSGYQHGRG